MLIRFFIWNLNKSHPSQKGYMGDRVSNVQYWLMLLLVGMMLCETFLAYSMLIFARQTGYACAKCYTNSFGTQLHSCECLFKLTGYYSQSWSGQVNQPFDEALHYF